MRVLITFILATIPAFIFSAYGIDSGISYQLGIFMGVLIIYNTYN
jgi:hypothetical protein